MPAMTICRTFALTVTCALLLGGRALAEGITVHDARDRDVVINDPARIVSIGGAITEILYALGYEDRLAAVDSTSLYPAAALRDKPNVGYMRQLSAEGVLGLHPSLVLAVQGSGPKETMDVLEAAKVPLVLVPETFSEAGLVDKIKLVGHAMGADRRAECLSAAVTGDLPAVARTARQGDQAGAGDVRDVAVEWPRHGGGPEHRRQRDHCARRRRQRHRQL